MSTHSRTRVDNRKQAVSIRLSRSDVRQIKRVADRLGARDSDVIRFAIKLMLTRLTLLGDPHVRGRSLIPMLIDSGAELLRHFELDASKLAAIVNEGVEDGQRVEPNDIQLIAMNALQRSFLQLRVPAEAAAGHTGNGNGGNNGHADSLDDSLRKYLCDKYLYAGAPAVSLGNGG